MSTDGQEHSCVREEPRNFDQRSQFGRTSPPPPPPKSLIERTALSSSRRNSREK
ncbi:hypothetical protein LEMLEM_LOCUS10480 [Lemmus lemmus]